MEYEKVIEKLIEYGGLLSTLKDLNYKEGKLEMYNIDKKVKLLTNRIYSIEKSEIHLKDCGYHESLDKHVSIYVSGSNTSNSIQEYYIENLERRILAIENLIEDYITWGLPNNIRSESSEKGIKLNGKIFEFAWKKIKVS